MAKIDQVESVRKERTPVGSQRAPLRYKGLDKENFEPRWVLDSGDRLATFLDAGYEFVKPTSQGLRVGDPTVDSSKGLDGRVSKSAGRGSKERLYLMQLPRKFYEADQLLKQREVDATEETMHVAGKGKKGKGGDDLDSPDYGKVSLVRKDVAKGGIPKDDD